VSSFHTTISIPTLALPADYVRMVNAEHPDAPPLGPTDEVPDVEVEVTYKEGWFTPGRYHGAPENCYPDEGEDPTIEGVILDVDGIPKQDILKALPDEILKVLIDQAWDNQKAQDFDGHDDYPDDMPDWDGPN
jgi:hypothetical protein